MVFLWNIGVFGVRPPINYDMIENSNLFGTVTLVKTTVESVLEHDDGEFMDKFEQLRSLYRENIITDANKGKITNDSQLYDLVTVIKSIPETPEGLALRIQIAEYIAKDMGIDLSVFNSPTSYTKNDIVYNGLAAFVIQAHDMPNNFFQENSDQYKWMIEKSGNPDFSKLLMRLGVCGKLVSSTPKTTVDQTNSTGPDQLHATMQRDRSDIQEMMNTRL
jgi:hypothetical protein